VRTAKKMSSAWFRAARLIQEGLQEIRDEQRQY
jgi:hypothetical protein